MQDLHIPPPPAEIASANRLNVASGNRERMITPGKYRIAFIAALGALAVFHVCDRVERASSNTGEGITEQISKKLDLNVFRLLPESMTRPVRGELTQEYLDEIYRPYIEKDSSRPPAEDLQMSN